MFNTPVLLLIFNRPEFTRKVFAAIRELRPRYLYIAADGPRADHPADEELCKQCKQIVAETDWDCTVVTLFRDKNLGCGAAPATAITWFFEQVTAGIILEDDCLPNQSFFEFCEDLLKRYNDNLNIMMICGTGYQPVPLTTDTYYFSKYPHAWGWATWRTAWAHYNFKLNEERSETISGVIKRSFANKRERKLWEHNFNQIINGLDAWDYQWMYWIWKNNGLCITPWKNMIANIGFGVQATHTFDKHSTQANMQQHTISGIRHPENISVNTKADEYERFHILIDSPKTYYLRRVHSAVNRIQRLLFITRAK